MVKRDVWFRNTKLKLPGATFMELPFSLKVKEELIGKLSETESSLSSLSLKGFRQKLDDPFFFYY